MSDEPAITKADKLRGRIGALLPLISEPRWALDSILAAMPLTGSAMVAARTVEFGVCTAKLPDDIAKWIEVTQPANIRLLLDYMAWLEELLGETLSERDVMRAARKGTT